MKSFKMLFEEEQKSEGEQALEALKAEVNTINEYLFKLIDKYTYASLTGLPISKISEDRNIQWLLNKSGNLTMIEDNRRLLINAINEYDVFYKKIIAKSDALKKEKVLKEKSDPKKQTNPLDAFPFLEKAKFSEDIASNIEACKKLCEYMMNVNFPALSVMVNEKFYQEIQKMKNDLSGFAEVQKMPDEVKIESELDDVPNVIDNEVKDGEKEEEKPNEEVPEELKNDTEEVDDMVDALADHVDDENFMELISKTIEQNKKVNQELGAYLKEHPDGQIAEKQKEIAKELGDITNHMLPALWAKNFLLRMKDANESWYIKQILNLLNEDYNFDDKTLLEVELNPRQLKKKKAKMANGGSSNKMTNENGDDGTNNGTDNGADNGNGAADNGKNKDTSDTKDDAAATAEINLEDLNKKSSYLVDTGIAELMQCENASKFKSSYKDWVEKVNTLYSEIIEINNEEVNNSLKKYENADDPLIKAAACAKAVEALTNAEKKEDNTEKEQDKTNPTDEQGNSEADTAGSKPDSDDINDKEEGEGLTAESVEDNLLIHNFRNRLNERFK